MDQLGGIVTEAKRVMEGTKKVIYLQFSVGILLVLVFYVLLKEWILS